MLCRRLDLAHPLEIAHGGGDVLDTDAEQSCHGNLQQAGKAIQCLNLHHLAFFKAIKRCARYAGLPRDFVRAQAGAEPEGFQPVANIVIANRHSWFPPHIATPFKNWHSIAAFAKLWLSWESCALFGIAWAL